MTLTHDDYYDGDEVLHSRTVGIDLGSSSRQIDYQLQYTRPLSKNRKLGLFAYYAQDYLHQAHQYDYGLGIKINGSFRNRQVEMKHLFYPVCLDRRNSARGHTPHGLQLNPQLPKYILPHHEFHIYIF